MRKLIIMLLCISMLCGFAACQDSPNETTTLPMETTSAPSGSTTEPEGEAPKPAKNETVILNDNPDANYEESLRLGENDGMAFSPNWKQSLGYPTRFTSGDEHWITTDQIASGESATCTVRFFGNGIQIFGHTGPSGGMVSITLDGVSVGKADFYSKTRIEALEGKYKGTLAPFYEVEGLENKDHEVVITYLAGEKNPLQSGKPELAIDYAVITRLEGSNPTVGGSLSTVEGVFDAYVGDPDRYSYVSDYVKVYKAFGSMTEDDRKDQVTLFQNDVVNGKIDILVGKDDVTLKASATVFKNAVGETLPDGCIQLSFLDYVINHQTDKKVYDILGDAERKFDAQSYGALFISFVTDEKTPAGEYSGSILIEGGGTTLAFPYTVEVVALDLSVADDVLTVDLWQYPYSANRYYSGKTVLEYFGTDHNSSDKTSLRYIYLDDRYEAQLAEQIRLYAAAGGDVITATVVEDAWSNQTTDPYPSMVKWTKGKDGTWKFDYTDFDKWVQLNLDNGVDGKIKCYSLAAWGSKVVFLLESTNMVYSTSYEIGSTVWKTTWTAFLKDFMAHVKEKGWFDLVYLAMDERGEDEIKAVCDLVQSVTDENGVSFKMAMAVNRLHAEKYFDNFADLSVSSSQFDKENLDAIVQHRIALGLSTTFYTCGGTAGALTNEPYDTPDFFYRLYQKGANGYLRWALDAFTDQPLVNTDHWKFVAGDESLIYPDRLTDAVMTVQSSVRFQAIIESYRKLCALEALRALSLEASVKVDALIAAYAKGNTDVKARVEQMEKDVLKLAKELLKA